VHARAAAAAGVGILIDSDAHSPGGLDALRYGIWTARRAWLGAEAIVNTLPWRRFDARRKRA
jgi:DNA polymerase (family 10)